MTSSKNVLVTDDLDVIKEVDKIKPVKGLLGKVINKPSNPHWQLCQDYFNDKISVDKFHNILRGKLLESVYKMNKQPYPSEPTIRKEKKLSKYEYEIENIMQGWGKACNLVDCANASNKFWLGILLKDIVEGKLEAEQGKEEEIEELLSEWY